MRDKAVLVETTILVDCLRGSDAAAEYMDKGRTEGDLLCSTVTQAELIVGSRTRGAQFVMDYLGYGWSADEGEKETQID